MIKEAENKTYQDFPTTRYQGSKRKILEWIYGHLKNIPFDTALDAFGGTGAVSYLFKTMGKEVTYNDSLKFNYTIGKAIIENNNVRLSESEVNELLDLGEVEAQDRFISKHFKDIYFTNDENEWLDKFHY